MNPIFPPKLRNQLRISAGDVRLGMFISELDRPWVETPFMLQGFQLNETPHLQMLRDFVSHVVIDPQRSTTDSLTHLPWDALHETEDEIHATQTVAPPIKVVYTSNPASIMRLSFFASLKQQWRNVFKQSTENITLQQPKPYYLRYASQQPDAIADVEQLSETERQAALASKLTPPSTPQFSNFIETLYPRDVRFAPLDLKDRLQLWWGKWSSTRAHLKSRLLFKSPQVASRLPEKNRHKFLPDSIPLVVYRDQKTIEEESVRARVIINQADTVLKKMVQDIQADLSISLDDVKPVVDVLVESVISNPTALMWSARMRDQSKKTYVHGLKVAIYMMALGRHLGFPKEQLSELGSIGLLLDIGMLKLPSTILEKQYELTPDEYALLTQHVEYGMQTLEQNDRLPYNIACGIREHHERIDGSGYPQGLTGDAISIYGRMAGIADSFAAMTTTRSHDVTHSAFDALKELFKEAETKLHAPLVEQFVHAISIFPVGSLIELSSGEVAIVLEHNKVRRLEPRVLVLTNSIKEMLDHPFILDLMAKNKSNSEHKKILRGLPDGAYDISYRDYYLN